MKEINIVTAFFDIGRSNYNTLQRSNDQYFNNFEYWARIKNRVIAFCGNEEHKKRILEIRKKFNQEQNTEVIVINDIKKIIPEQYNKMVEISTNDYFKNIRFMKNILSDKPLYDLINYLKVYFINYAREKYNIDTQLAWVDFGFNHGGANYKDCEEFNFLWEYDCKDKVHFFYENELDVRPMFEIIRTVKPDPILGAMFIIPAKYTKILWDKYLESINSMLDMGFIDDDQPLLLMTYRKTKDISIVTKCRNCEQLKLCGGEHMHYTPHYDKYIILRKIKRNIEKRIRIYKYHKQDKKILLKTKDE